MREFVIENFTKAFFLGVVDIQFFELFGKRTIRIAFNTEEDLLESMKRALESNARELFLIDKDNLNVQVDRDNYETAMYMTAQKGAMDAWMQRFERMVAEEREAEENEEGQDSAE